MSAFVSIAGILLIICVLMEVQNVYQIHFEWVEDVNLNKVLIVWYNKYSDDNSITREHKILYDTGRNKK
jgi:hypothetical protein